MKIFKHIVTFGKYFFSYVAVFIFHIFITNKNLQWNHELIGNGSFYYMLQNTTGISSASLVNSLVVLAMALSATLTCLILPQKNRLFTWTWLMGLLFGYSPWIWYNVIPPMDTIAIQIFSPLIILLFSIKEKNAISTTITIITTIIYIWIFPIGIIFLLAVMIGTLLLHRNTHNTEITPINKKIFIVLAIVVTLMSIIIANTKSFSNYLNFGDGDIETTIYKTSAQLINIEGIFPLIYEKTINFQNSINDKLLISLPIGFLVLLFLGSLVSTSKNNDKKKSSFIWGATILIFLILSLGPLFKINDTQTNPIIPIPYIILIQLFKNLQHTPLYFIPLTLLIGIIFISIKFKKFTENSAVKKIVTIVTVAVVFIPQYFAYAVPKTDIYDPIGYENIKEKEKQTAIIEISPDVQLLSPFYMQLRRNTHKQLQIINTSAQAQQLEEYLNTPKNLIPQQTQDQYRYILLKENIQFFDIIHSLPLSFGGNVYNSSAQETQNTILQLLTPNKIYQDDQHTLYRIPYADKPKNFLSFSSYDKPWIKKESYGVKISSGATLEYFNFEENKQNINLSLQVSSLRYLQIHILLNEVVKKTIVLDQKTNNQTINLELYNIDPGKNIIEFKIQKADGSLLQNNNRLSSLQIHNIRCTATEQKNSSNK